MQRASKSYWKVLVGALGLVATGAIADTYTYNYFGPSFTGSSDRVAVSFTTSAPLAPATSYLSTAAAGVLGGTVTVFNPNGVVGGFDRKSVV